MWEVYGVDTKKTCLKQVFSFAITNRLDTHYSLNGI